MTSPARSLLPRTDPHPMPSTNKTSRKAGRELFRAALTAELQARDQAVRNLNDAFQTTTTQHSAETSHGVEKQE
jgi:hypothetical protein